MQFISILRNFFFPFSLVRCQVPSLIVTYRSFQIETKSKRGKDMLYTLSGSSKKVCDIQEKFSSI